jgi:IS30 family transposase
MFLRLHEAGLTDTAIGKVVGKHAKTISRWRQILEQEQHFAKG